MVGKGGELTVGKVKGSVRGRVKIGESGREGLNLKPPPFSHACIINPLSQTLTLTFSLNPPFFPPLTFLLYLPSLSSTLALLLFPPYFPTLNLSALPFPTHNPPPSKTQMSR
jgi:hypothetical protein